MLVCMQELVSSKESLAAEVAECRSTLDEQSARLDFARDRERDIEVRIVARCPVDGPLTLVPGVQGTVADLNAQLEDEHEAHRDEMAASVKSYEEALARATAAEERAETNERKVSVRQLRPCCLRAHSKSNVVL